jgi:hypothetical protein
MTARTRFLTEWPLAAAKLSESAKVRKPKLNGDKAIRISASCKQGRHAGSCPMANCSCWCHRAGR